MNYRKVARFPGNAFLPAVAAEGWHPPRNAKGPGPPFVPLFAWQGIMGASRTSPGVQSWLGPSRVDCATPCRGRLPLPLLAGEEQVWMVSSPCPAGGGGYRCPRLPPRSGLEKPGPEDRIATLSVNCVLISIDTVLKKQA